MFTPTKKVTFFLTLIKRKQDCQEIVAMTPIAQHTELVEALAEAALGLGNKIAWRTICDGMTKATAPALTIQQRHHLRRSAWEALKRLRRERRALKT